MDSESEKKQLVSTSESTANVLEKLSNGCATQVEKEQAKGEEGKPAAAVEDAAKEAAVGEVPAGKATAAGAATAEDSPAAGASPAAAETADKTPATPATTDGKLKLKLNNKNCSVKEKEKETASKVNGLKQLNKKKTQPDSHSLKTQEPPSEKLLQALPLSNGLANGKKQSEEEKSVKSVEKEQDKGKEEQQQEAPTGPSVKLAPPINGKTKKNNHRIPVNNISKESSAAASAPESQSEAAEPPNKRPKLQLHEKIINKTDPAITLPEAPNEDELEDTSDEAYLVRHQRALIEERRRFETFLKLSWTNRSRANRRADSRAESSGANTPDPASPAASLHLAGPAADNESIPSPLAHPMQQHPLDAINNESANQTDVPQTATTIKRKERRRTTSSKLKEHDRRSATPDTREVSSNGKAT